MFNNLLSILTVAVVVNAHIAAFHKAMYCLNGLDNNDEPNSAEASLPLIDKSWDDFWMHGKCKDFPPADGEFLDLPVGGKTKLELSSNRGLTTLSWDGRYTSLFPTNDPHPDYDTPGAWDNTCVKIPNLHAENQTRAAGTVLAIAYKSDIHDVKLEDMTVISVLPNSPWHREVEYEIPADLPACDDCICAWSWVPGGCGEANMYMNAIRCRVTGARPDAPKIAKPVPAKWCENKPEDCVTGAKTITIWHQHKDIDTIDLDGVIQAEGNWATPSYNEKMGFHPGAQNDIFESTTTSNPDPNPQVTPEPQGEPKSKASSEPQSTPESQSAPDSQTTATPEPQSTPPPINPPQGSDGNCTESGLAARSGCGKHRHHHHHGHRGHRKQQRRLARFHAGSRLH
ncbi:hypothetical protein BKA62DRAFT_717982 [Auriculariales sp. MPI-PUGE-AT-0066]|nr:hypothetical protein BKA62DRAFT_717982 [Auriculariales sp. MPI-PUGE-AT-0066]